MKRTGFTFVELLVVITIIAILTGAAVASFGNTNIKSRNARRLADIETIRSALELCRTEAGSYPLSIYTPDNITCDSVVYLTSTPKDPKYVTPDDEYVYVRSSATSYTISCTLEGGGSCSFSNP
ncbi:type II secretion system GspH family protein [Patescibacteria group bacterium]|nr:type II secretion system GspH family protein [Patescibacteria group bacterium]MBU1256865.1 type II secretion system GspH family protein [Patescibacteria group bacterium]MBU1457492.1 type II secretion system GspH family protein [Patescibacteria group bacterium]